MESDTSHRAFSFPPKMQKSKTISGLTRWLSNFIKMKGLLFWIRYLDTSEKPPDESIENLSAMFGILFCLSIGVSIPILLL